MKKILILSLYAALLCSIVILQAYAEDQTNTVIFEGPVGQKNSIQIPQSARNKMNFFKGLETVSQWQHPASSDMHNDQEVIEIPYSPFIETIIEKYPELTYESFIGYFNNLVELLQSTSKDPFDQSKINSELVEIAHAFGCDQPFPEYMLQSLATYFYLFTPIELQGYQGGSGLNAIAFSPDSNYALIASYSHNARLWNMRNKNSAHSVKLRGHTDKITSVAFSPDGNYALTGSNDNTARLWDLYDKDHPTSIILQGHTDKITSVAFSPDGNYALTGSDDHTARLWNLSDKDHPTSIILRGHTYKVTSVAISTDNSHALIGSGNLTAFLWDLRDKNNMSFVELTTNPDIITHIAFSPDGNVALLGSTLWNLQNKSNAALIVTFKPNGTSALAQTSKQLQGTSPDWKSLLIGIHKSYDDTDSDNDDINFNELGEDTPDDVPELRTYNTSVAFRHDGNYALTAFENIVRLWDLNDTSYNTSIALPVDMGHAISVAFSSDGNYALIGSDLARVYLWNLNPFKDLDPLEILTLLDLMNSPDKRTFIMDNLNFFKNLPEPIKEKVACACSGVVPYYDLVS